MEINDLYVAVSEKTGAIYYASTDKENFDELTEEFKGKYPDIKDVVEWSMYENRLCKKNIEAMQKGAFLYPHVLELYWHNRETYNFTQMIYKVELHFCDLGTETYLFSDKKKANIFINTQIVTKDTLKFVDEIDVYETMIDTNEQKLTKVYAKDRCGRMTKVKKGE